MKIVSPIQQTENMSDKSRRVDIGKRYKPHASKYEQKSQNLVQSTQLLQKCIFDCKEKR